MSIFDDRLSALEKTLTLLKRDEAISRDELNRNTTMLLGIGSAQQLDIKEIKIHLLSIDDRLTSLEGGLTSVDSRLTSLEEKVERGFTSLEAKFEQVLQLLKTLPKADK